MLIGLACQSHIQTSEQNGQEKTGGDLLAVPVSTLGSSRPKQVARVGDRNTCGRRTRFKQLTFLVVLRPQEASYVGARKMSDSRCIRSGQEDHIARNSFGKPYIMYATRREHVLVVFAIHGRDFVEIDFGRIDDFND